MRRLAAAFERDTLHVRLAGVAEEELADLGRAGEGDHVDVHVPAERLAGGLAEARHDLQDAVGEPRFDRELGEPDDAERRLLGRLQDHAVARRERRPELPRGHQEREVPGHDRADDAERLAQDRDVRVGECRSDLVVDLVDRLAVPGDALRRVRDVDDRASRIGLPMSIVSSSASSSPCSSISSASRWSAACASSGRSATTRPSRRRGARP